MRTIPTERYYIALEHLMDVFDRSGKKSGFQARSFSEFETWKTTARTKLAEITGINRMERCDLQPVLLESVKMDSYRRDKMIIQTEPDVWMPFYILVPDDIKMDERLPCIIAPHGHVSGGKYAVAGRSDVPAVQEMIERFHYDYGVQFVKRGYIVFCPDARGFGERREWTGQSDEEVDFLNSTCTQLSKIAIGCGQSVTGMWTWDLMRLLDYIETRKDCDSDRIGCCGLSGGGLQTLWLAAMDDRVTCAVISGYFYGYKDSLLKLSDNCACNYVPSLWEHADMGDLGALIAPRPLFIQSGTEDELNGERGMDNVLEQLKTASGAYGLLQSGDKIYHHIFEGGHRWDGGAIYEWLGQWMNSNRRVV